MGISPPKKNNQEGIENAVPKIRRIDIPQYVRVRKYAVDCEALSRLLRKHKALIGKSNKELSEALNVPVTMVAHWFRKDECFSVPAADVWLALKDHLSITTNEFDTAITTFEERRGVYEKAERCYLADGIAPTLTSASAGSEKIITEETKLKKICAAAVRGRYSCDGRTEQQVELSDREYANALTTVQKDSLVCETARIRKLTPKECFRLMGFNDADYEKAAAVNSDTQLYKQTGNSIGVPVVEYIFQNLVGCGALKR